MILSFTNTTIFCSCLHNVRHLTLVHWELQSPTLTHELPSSIPYQFRILKLTQRVLND
jgi:hypothetical protein